MTFGFVSFLLQSFISSLEMRISYSPFAFLVINMMAGWWRVISSYLWRNLGKEMEGNNFRSKQARKTEPTLRQLGQLLGIMDVSTLKWLNSSWNSSSTVLYIYERKFLYIHISWCVWIALLSQQKSRCTQK